MVTEAEQATEKQHVQSFAMQQTKALWYFHSGMPRYTARATAPDEDSLARGSKFFSQIDRGADGHSGVVWDEQGTARWRYGVRKNSSGRRPENPFNTPDFVVKEPNAKDEVIIRRTSFVPPVFDITEAGRVIGRIRLRSMFRNKYAIEVDGVNSWTFRMPLFTVRFYGDSSAGPEMWVHLGRSKMEWVILIKAGVNERPVLAALAFIHCEWWNYG
jgi:hypothetical protein